jgi:hypothetical protein
VTILAPGRLASLTRPPLQTAMSSALPLTMSSALPAALKRIVEVSVLPDPEIFLSLKDVPLFIVTFNRMCCRIKDGSPICPPGSDDQYVNNEIPPWSKHLIRCKEDLCNTGTGDGNDDTGGGGDSTGGSIIVNGRNPNSASGNEPVTKMLLILFLGAIKLLI